MSQASAVRATGDTSPASQKLSCLLPHPLPLSYMYIPQSPPHPPPSLPPSHCSFISTLMSMLSPSPSYPPCCRVARATPVPHPQQALSSPYPCSPTPAPIAAALVATSSQPISVNYDCQSTLVQLLVMLCQEPIGTAYGLLVMCISIIISQEVYLFSYLIH